MQDKGTAKTCEANKDEHHSTGLRYARMSFLEISNQIQQIFGKEEQPESLVISSDYQVVT